MSCKPRDFLELARSLQGTTGEAVARCIVSRAYYAALHEVDCTFAERKAEFRVDGESSHREIISRATVYGSSIEPGRGSAAEIAKIMTRLRRSRNKADYKIEEEFSNDVSDDSLVRAEKILELCNNVTNKRAVAAEQAKAGG